MSVLIVFDLDGTLIDSVADLAASANELVTTLGGHAIEVTAVQRMVGDGARVLVRRALVEGGLDPDTPEALPRFLEIYDRRLLDHTKAYPGVRETLAIAAARARLAVLTNKPAAPSERLLESLDLRSFFDVVIGGDNPLGRKPDPAAIQSLLGERPTEIALLVGDSPIDFDTARAACCSFAWARYGFGAVRFNGGAPDTPYVMDKPADLVAILDRLAGLSTT